MVSNRSTPTPNGQSRTLAPRRPSDEHASSAPCSNNSSLRLARFRSESSCSNASLTPPATPSLPARLPSACLLPGSGEDGSAPLLPTYFSDEHAGGVGVGAAAGASASSATTQVRSPSPSQLSVSATASGGAAAGSSSDALRRRRPLLSALSMSRQSSLSSSSARYTDEDAGSPLGRSLLKRLCSFVGLRKVTSVMQHPAAAEGCPASPVTPTADDDADAAVTAAAVERKRAKSAVAGGGVAGSLAAASGGGFDNVAACLSEVDVASPKRGGGGVPRRRSCLVEVVKCG